MSSSTDNPGVDEIAIIVDVEEPEETNDGTIFAPTTFFQRLNNVCNVVAIRLGLVAPFARLRSFEEETIIMPPSTITFIITALLAFVEIKSQGNYEFPFKTHPQTIMVSVTSLLVYGLTSVAEFVISDYAIIASMGRIASLFLFVASLGSLIYF